MPRNDQVKKLNLDRIKTVMQDGKRYTKTSLAETSGLSVATCGNLLGDMLQTGEVNEVDLADSTGGRPSRQFEYNVDFAYALALYVRKEAKKITLAYRVVNMVGKTVDEGEQEYDDLRLYHIDGKLAEVLMKHPNIKALAVGVPSVVQNGIAVNCDIAPLSNLNIIEYFEANYDLKVTVLNDVNCTAFGYASKQKLTAQSSLFYIYYPVDGCPGSGIIVNGKVLHGATHFAGEVSHIPYSATAPKTEHTPGTPPPLQRVADIIVSAICLINPSTVVVSGLLFTADYMADLTALVQKACPAQHMPTLTLESGIHDSYLCGLTTAARQKLSYNYKLVEK